MKKFMLLFLTMLMSSGGFARAGDVGERMALAPPMTKGGMPLMDALSARQANRSIGEAMISDQDLSNILWAAWGVNRSDGRRTAPTAMNKQKVNLYVALESGVWLYDAAKNELELALAQDVRKKLGGAPVTLLYAGPSDDKFSAMHMGSLYQNVGLYCASAGLANVVKDTGSDALDGVLALPKGYKVFIIQSVGPPK